jgi:hypothetical protein
VEASKVDTDMEENENVKVAISTLYEVFEPQEVCKHLTQAKMLKACIQGFYLLHRFGTN